MSKTPYIWLTYCHGMTQYQVLLFVKIIAALLIVKMEL